MSEFTDLNLGEVRKYSVTLTATQVKALASGVTLLESPGAEKYILPLHCQFKCTVGSEVFTGGSDLRLRYSSSATNASATIASTFITNASDRVSFGRGYQAAVATNASNVVDDGITLIVTGANFAGNASDDGTLKVILYYTIVDVS